MKSTIHSFTPGRILALLLLAAAWIAPLGAQTSTPAASSGAGPTSGKGISDAGEPVQGSDYLERQIAAREFSGLRSLLRTDVFRLTRMVNNFGKDVPGSDKAFAEIKESYRSGMELYYRRKLVESYESLKKGRADALDLYKRFSELYQQQSMKILKECSESMVDVELSDVKPDEKAPTDSDDLKRNQVRLQIAYNQISQAEEMARNNRFDGSVEHYRLAKIFAVEILKDMQITDDGKKAVEEKYKMDLMDALGRNPSTRPSTGNGPAKTSP